MKTYVQRQQATPKTIQSKASNQASAEEVLQSYKKKIVQMKSMYEEEPLQGKFNDTAQREEPDEEELLQGKFDTVQREEIDEEEILQGKFETAQCEAKELPPSGGGGANNTGMPDNLKSGIENLSGYSMDDVRVHYNSPKPAQLQALAYAQGTDIHVAPGQEQHLPHEAWHVVQQKQGRVQPTTQLQGINVNDNEGLEKEADVMGGRSLNIRNIHQDELNINKIAFNSAIQKRDTSNPHKCGVANKGTTGGWALTAHHIIPLSLLSTVFNHLSDKQKAKLRKTSLPSDIKKKEKTNSYIEWPKGNLFYGPNTSIRAEPGDKDGFDYDAVFFLPDDVFIKMKEYYDRLLPLNKKELNEEEKKELFGILKAFYEYTRNRDSVIYNSNDWTEITTEKEFTNAQSFRKEINKYSFYKISQIPDNKTVHPIYDKIIKDGGDYKNNNTIIKGEFKETFFYIKMDHKNNKNVIDHIKKIDNDSKKKATISTYLPSELYKYYQEGDQAAISNYLEIPISKLRAFLEGENTFVESENLSLKSKEEKDRNQLTDKIIRSLSSKLFKKHLKNKYIEITGSKIRYKNVCNTYRTISDNYKELKIEKTHGLTQRMETIRKAIVDTKTYIKAYEAIHEELDNINNVTGNLVAKISIKEKDSIEALDKRLIQNRMDLSFLKNILFAMSRNADDIHKRCIELRSLVHKKRNKI